jgi:hypothetical protein
MAKILGIHTLSDTKNLFINGNFDFWQRNTTFTVAGGDSSTLVADRWRNVKTTIAASLSLSRSTDVPNAESVYSIKLQPTVADTSVDASDFSSLEQRVEGQFALPAYNSKVTVSFWIKSSVTGAYHYYIRNSATDVSYIAPFTVDSANTWEKKVITINLAAKTGTWLTDNGVGLRAGFMLQAGSTYQNASTNTWLSGNYTATSAQVNFMSSTSNVMYISQMSMVIGDSTPKSFNLAGKNYGAELALCQRYYEKSYDIDTVPGTNTSVGVFVTTLSGSVTNGNYWPATVFFRAPKRIQSYSGNVWTAAGVSGSVRLAGVDRASSLSVWKSENRAVFDNTTGLLIGAANDSLTFHWAVDAEL